LKNKLRIAIAGAGMVTRHHLKAWSRLSDVKIVAICNRNLDKALNRAKEFGIPKAYSNLAEMLEKERPDALQTGQPFETNGLDNLKTLKLVDEAYRFAGI
jgi:predicted dehydrogenase